MTALVSFERVFEVLDLPFLITERPDATPVPDGPVSVEFDNVHFGYPAADKVSLASLVVLVQGPRAWARTASSRLAEQARALLLGLPAWLTRLPWVLSP